jgi:hypothetical protein
MSKWDEYKAKMGTTRPWDFVNPNTEYAADTVAEERFNICKSCPRIIPVTNQCRECGCFMFAKTKLLKASCPLGKW